MNISKKWSAAAAAFLSVALVASGAATANAAPGDIVNPQPNGSQGSFFLFDGDGVSAEQENRVLDRSEFLSSSASISDPAADIVPTDYAPNWGNAVGDSVYKFVARTTELSGGTNAWRAYDKVEITGPNDGVWWEDFTLEGKTQGNGAGIESVFSEGGDWITGLAFTNIGGATVYATIYRTIHVTAGTGKYTIDPVAVEGPGVPYAPNFSNFSATAGASAVIRNGNLNIDATSAAAGKTVDVWAEGTGKVASVTLDASGKAINTVPAGIVNGTRLAVVENEVEIAWIATSTFAWTEPTDAANAATKVAVADPAEGESTVTIPTGIANQTFTAVGWSTPVELGTVTTGANGDAIVDAAALGLGAHTIALFDNTDQIVAWGTFTASSSTTSQTDLTVEALTSNKFSLEGVNTSVNLGAAKRGATTTPVALGAFTVVDDRDLLPGWTLNATVADFTNASANNDVITKAALGLAPKKVGGAVDGVSLGTAQLAGSATYSALVAQGAADSSTLEAGTQFDADLTFAVPATAKKGTYTSTLTLTLASK